MAVAASETTLVWSDTALGETPTAPTSEGKPSFSFAASSPILWAEERRRTTKARKRRY